MYELVWLPRARDELLAIAAATPDSARPLLIWAIGDIDYRLSRRPADEGESRPGNRRIAFSWPLVVVYEVDDVAHRVRIGHAWTHN